MALVLLSMTSVQVGTALSTHLIGRVGVAGTTWLRLSFAAAMLLLIVRPRPGTLKVPGSSGARDSLRAQGLLAAAALGATIGVMNLAFLNAVARLPLGTVVAVEFLGPLTVAALRTGRRAGLLWPAIALAGVMTLTRPWTQSPSDRIGGLFAVGAAAGWGTYVLLTHQVGKRCSGLTGLSISFPVAALVSAPLGAPQAIGHLTPLIVAAAAGIAILNPLLPYAAEMVALRMLPPSVFGVWMSLEPAIGTGVGLVALHQIPTILQLLGVLLVVVASVGAEGSRSVWWCGASSLDVDTWL